MAVYLPLLVLVATMAEVSSAPLYHGCLDNISTALPYCDHTLSYEARTEDVLKRLTIDEKVGLLSPHDAPNYCGAHASPVPSIGLPDWRWLTEANTQVAGCTSDGKRCSTVFVGPTGMAASFNRSSWYAKGDVISTEMRVHNNLNQAPGFGGVALSGFGPNINCVKDPRYGRNSELPGECPFLSGSYAVAYTKGMQQVSAKTGHLKMLAYLKHYTAYNKESGRFTWKANVTTFDFWDSYLPQYEMAFKEGSTSGAMCSYFTANGVPSCGSDWLMNQLVRKAWGRPDAVFMSDCSAVANFEKNGFAVNDTDASAKALNGGLDVYGGWGDHLWTEGYLHKAITAGEASEATLDDAVRRTTMQKMKAGVFDPLEGQEWVGLGEEDLNTTLHQQVAYEAALQSLVLLKNGEPRPGHTARPLPLKRGIKLAVVGPLAFETTGLVSDYAKWSNGNPPPSIASALTASNTGGSTTASIGVQVDSKDSSGIAAAVAAASEADATVLVLGLTKAQEHEGIDRADTKLPGLQLSFAHTVLANAKGPVVLVLCNGGIVSIDTLIHMGANKTSNGGAIIEAFNPVDHGTRAVAESIFGGANRWGKLPVTIYPSNYTAALDAAGAGIANYEFAKGPGRGYRYYKGFGADPYPVGGYPFGHGMSYTTFSHHCTGGLGADHRNLTFTCVVKNTGKMHGDEVVMVFHRVSEKIRAAASALHPVPAKNLVDFERVSLGVGDSETVTFTLDAAKIFAITSLDGTKKVWSGMHDVIFSTGGGDDVVISVPWNV